MTSHASQHRSDDSHPAATGEPERREQSLVRLHEMSLPLVDLGICPPDQRQDRLNELTASEFVLVIGNDLRIIPLLVDRLSQRFIDFGICEPMTAGRLGVAVGEAVVNAIVHGNLEVDSEIREQPGDVYDKLVEARRLDPRFRRRRVRIVCCYTDQEGRVTVRDEGRGFDVAEVPDPTQDENLDRPYGRGILLIRAFFDEVRYSAKGNAVTMIKRSSENTP